MSLSQSQCAEIAAWATGIAELGEPPRLVVDRNAVPGVPVKTDDELRAHPEDYLALRRWADLQARPW